MADSIKTVFTKSKIEVRVKQFFIQIGELSNFAGRFFKESFTAPFEFKELLRQCYQMGNRSLILVCMTGFIIGLVLTLQSRPTMIQFGAVSMMPNMVGISIVREIGPVITALICAGRIASGIGAELGSMKVTEQIDAMEVSGTNPFKYLVVTRILATTLMIPILVVFGDLIALLGFVIGLVGCFKGFNSKKGTAGVGIAANTAVVMASLLLFIVDFIAVFISDIFYEL